MKKIIGYFFAGLGIIALAIASFPPLQKSLPFPESIYKDISFTIATIALVGIGILFLVMSSSSTKKPKDVPIYDKTGKKIVGYRQTAK